LKAPKAPKAAAATATWPCYLLANINRKVIDHTQHSKHTSRAAAAVAAHQQRAKVEKFKLCFVMIGIDSQQAASERKKVSIMLQEEITAVLCCRNNKSYATYNNK